MPWFSRSIRAACHASFHEIGLEHNCAAWGKGPFVFNQSRDQQKQPVVASRMSTSQSRPQADTNSTSWLEMHHGLFGLGGDASGAAVGPYSWSSIRLKHSQPTKELERGRAHLSSYCTAPVRVNLAPGLDSLGVCQIHTCAKCSSNAVKSKLHPIKEEKRPDLLESSEERNRQETELWFSVFGHLMGLAPWLCLELELTLQAWENQKVTFNFHEHPQVQNEHFSQLSAEEKRLSRYWHQLLLYYISLRRIVCTRVSRTQTRFGHVLTLIDEGSHSGPFVRYYWSSTMLPLL